MALGSTQPQLKMSTRNIPGDKGGRCVRLTTSPTSRAACHEIWEPEPPGPLWATLGLLRDSFTLLPNQCCRVHLENLVSLTSSKKILPFIDPNSLSPCFQEGVPVLNRNNPDHKVTHYFYNAYLNCIFSSTPGYFN
jgi:hypothetical protein